MIAGMCTSVQAALDDLSAQLDGSRVRVRGCSDRAFAKARRGLSFTVFEALNASLSHTPKPWIDAHRWHGHRVVAADGSRLRVATRRGAELDADHYVFVLYLPGAELTLHAALGPADAAERQMLFEAIEHTQAGGLLVLDRGLAGNALIAALVQNRRAFCLRVDVCGWTAVKRFLRSGHREQCIMFDPPCAREAADYGIERTPTQVRLIRDVTPSGNVRILMTSLDDAQRYPADTFGSLYHARWRIEEAFKRIKHRWRIEAVSGLSTLALRQDFAAKILADNLHGLLAHACIATSTTNRTYALGALKPILVGCLLRVRHSRAHAVA